MVPNSDVYKNCYLLILHYIRIYGSKPPRTRPRMVYVAININSDVVDNKCYIPTGYLSYLTFDTTSYQSQEPNDKLVRMTQPVLSL